MSQTYLLLRNNKQTGPYQLEELLRLHLKPFDLVWMEGKSAGWRYPSEIDTLKSYVTESVPANTVPLPADTTEPVRPSGMDVTASTPRPGNHSKKIYVSLPGKNAFPASETPVEKQSSFEERAEKMRQKAMGQAEASVHPEEPEVATKYSRSLEDIKDEYVNCMHGQKRKKTTVKFMLLPAAILIGGITAVSIKWSKTYKEKTTGQELTETKVVIPEPAIKNNETKRIVTKPAMKKAGQKKAVPYPKDRITRTNNKIDVRSKESMANSVDPAIPEREQEDPASTKQNETTGSSPRTDLPETTAVYTKPSGKDREPLSRLIDIHVRYLPPAGKGISGLNVSVKNNSDEVLKLIAIDVFYRKNGIQIDKKTLYFTNVYPNQSTVQDAPGNQKATTASYQLGLISSQRGGLYVVK